GAPASATLGVGDRLDTDIAGAHAAGMDAVLVLTGVHGVVDVSLAPTDQRPRYVAADLGSLLQPYEEAAPDGHNGWRCGTATARLDDTGLTLEPGGRAEDGLRAGLAALWEAIDDRGHEDDGVVSAAHELARWWDGRTGAQQAVPWAPDDQEDADGR
ncbi:MAG TPA: HAD hydrolase-like protein, partial [Segeticoccus sp.]|uniref:HAD hydrolase-like protein n=1 Tax=Segeticoccus sp. TaxID=2706531 RepID=UPI002D80B974